MWLYGWKIPNNWLIVPGNNKRSQQVTRKKVNIQKSITFKYINNKQVEVEIKDTHRYRQQTYDYRVGEVGERDKLGDWDWRRFTIFKVNNE